MKQKEDYHKMWGKTRDWEDAAKGTRERVAGPKEKLRLGGYGRGRRGGMEKRMKGKEGGKRKVTQILKNGELGLKGNSAAGLAGILKNGGEKKGRTGEIRGRTRKGCEARGPGKRLLAGGVKG